MIGIAGFPEFKEVGLHSGQYSGIEAVGLMVRMMLDQVVSQMIFSCNAGAILSVFGCDIFHGRVRIHFHIVGIILGRHTT